MKNYLNFGLISLFLIALTGCGAGKVLVLEPVNSPCPIRSIHLQPTADTIKLEPTMAKKFEKILASKMYAKNKFTSGDEITLKYRFLQLNEGNRFSRWFLGGIGNAGEGTLTVEATYFDKSGKQIGKVQAEGKIGSGMFGGSFENAFEKAADEIVQYTYASLH